uniref:CSON007781 protein n=1 Tax=Culicoides sonorensis TaxID=179676 RepID=A0A336LXV6_CULSO
MEYKVEERDNKPYLTSTTEVLQDLDGEIMIHGNVSAAHNGQVEPITKILPIDLCKFLKGEKKSVLLNIVWNDLGKFGNIPKECPIKKQTVTIKDFTPDKDMIPAALPGGEYHVNILGELWRDGKMVALLEHVVVHATIDQ